MTPRATRSWPKHAFNVASLVVPSWLAWCVAFRAPHPGELTDAVKLALAPLWVALSCALVLRALASAFGREPTGPGELLRRLDVLTSAGMAMAWLSALAIIGAVEIGWASLAVVGLLGTGLFHVVVLRTLFTTRSADPVRSSAIRRTFSPSVVTEGEAVTEEVRLDGVRIPVGFRLFVTGCIGARWATSRYVVDAAHEGAELLLASEVGPAVRGDHHAPPLEVWLEDVFGLCRSVSVYTSEAQVTVLPAVRGAAKAPALLERGQGPRAPKAAARMPTEGQFDLREYRQGDDVRRIHWVRSLASRELVVRLPDELPPDQPHVRLVLDTWYPEALSLTCDAVDETLDSLVGVWLAVARSLAESGVRVTLVTAVRAPGASEPAKALQVVNLRAFDPARRLGAQVAWQDHVMVSQLLSDEATFVVSRGVLATPPSNGNVRWILVVPMVQQPQPPAFRSEARSPFPTGSSDNRFSHRRREAHRVARARTDHTQLMVSLRADIAKPPRGSLIAERDDDGAVRLEVLR